MQNSRLRDYDVQPPANLEFRASEPPAYSSAALRDNMPDAQSGELIGELNWCEASHPTCYVLLGEAGGVGRVYVAVDQLVCGH
jgi:hypothetical protein